jgi:hypothetical protein
MEISGVNQNFQALSFADLALSYVCDINIVVLS